MQKGKKYDQPANAIKRRAAKYWPILDSAVNAERLPSEDALREMELAYREEPLPENVMELQCNRLVLLSILTSIGVAYLLAVVGPLVPISALLSIAATVSVLLVLFCSFRFGLNWWLLISALIIPPIAAVALSLLTDLLSKRYPAAILLGLVLIPWILTFGRNPFSFYRDWLLTEPRLKPDSRRSFLRKPLSGPDPISVLVIIAVAIFVPAFSTTFAILSLIAISFGMMAYLVPPIDGHPIKTVSTITRQLRKILVKYLVYGVDRAGAPGVWIPKVNVAVRVSRFMLLLGTITLTFTVALTGFFPWDAPYIRSGMRTALVEAQSMKASLLGASDTSLRSEMAPVSETLLPWILPIELPPEPEQPPEFQPSKQQEGEWEKLSTSYSRREARRKAESAHYNEHSKRIEEQHERVVRRFNDHQISSKPHLWLNLVVWKILQGEKHYLWSFPLAVSLGIFLPMLCLTAMWTIPIVEMYKLEQELSELDVDDRPEWQWYVDRIRNSKQQALDLLGNTHLEREHLFGGIVPEADIPLLIDKRLLSEHAYFVGDSGSGKTSLGLMPLVLQLIRGRRGMPNSGNENQTFDNEPCPPMVILDLKGDPAFFQTVKHEVEAAHGSNNFRFFTPEKNKLSCLFDPFQSFQSESRSLVQLCQLLLDSLSLNHGEGYGRTYFSRQARLALMQAMAATPQPQTFEELYNILTDPPYDSNITTRDIFELTATIHALAQYPQLKTTQRTRDGLKTIHMPTLVRDGQVAYFWLPAATESISVREIGKLAVYSLLTAAIDRQRRGEKVTPIYLVIDEFQRLAAENFKVILEQARSFGVCVLLANQSRADLRTHDIDLRPTVNTNTRLKQFFSVTDPEEIKTMVGISGDEIASFTALSRGKNYREQEFDNLKPRMTTNDILEISDHPLDSILHVSRGSGYTQFGGKLMHVRSVWPMDIAVFKERSEMTWENAIQTEPAFVEPKVDVDSVAESEDLIGPVVEPEPVVVESVVPNLKLDDIEAPLLETTVDDSTTEPETVPSSEEPTPEPTLVSNPRAHQEIDQAAEIEAMERLNAYLAARYREREYRPDEQ